VSNSQIKRFKLKPGLEKWWLKNIPLLGDATWIHPKATRFLSYTLRINCSDIDVDIGFPENLQEWNDFDFVVVIDEEFEQPYGPFYSKLDNPNWEGNDFLNELVAEYNNLLSSLPFLEEIKHD